VVNRKSASGACEGKAAGGGAVLWGKREVHPGARKTPAQHDHSMAREAGRPDSYQGSAANVGGQMDNGPLETLYKGSTKCRHGVRGTGHASRTYLLGQRGNGTRHAS